MSNEKQPPTPKKDLTDNDAERLIYEAFRAGGAFVPQTPEEVARAEAEADEDRIELPASLRDPLAILKGKKAQRSVPSPSPYLDQSAVENLACAARNGGEIPPEVERKMDLDEEAAEGEQDGAK